MKIDKDWPARPQEKDITITMNFCEGAARLICFHDSRPPEEVAPALGISEKTLTRWREYGCPAYMKNFPSGRRGWHYCVQEALFWIIKKHGKNGNGIPLPELVRDWLAYWQEWQKTQKRAGRLDRIFLPKEYAASLTHYAFALDLYHNNPAIDIPRPTEQCIYTVSPEKAESRAFKIDAMERLDRAIARYREEE